MAEHPITPPPELVVKWIKSARYKDFMPYPEGYEQYEQRLTTLAARWGADQELEACCEWLHSKGSPNAPRLRVARRSKLPSLKEQALLAIDTAVADGRLSPDVSNVVRRALEALPD